MYEENSVCNGLYPFGKSVRVNISINEKLLADIDRLARSRHQSRSGCIAEACELLLGEVIEKRLAEREGL